MTNDFENKTKEYMQGWVAASAEGKYCEDNPYDKESVSYTEWDNGYTDACEWFDL